MSKFSQSYVIPIYSSHLQTPQLSLSACEMGLVSAFWMLSSNEAIVFLPRGFPEKMGSWSRKAGEKHVKTLDPMYEKKGKGEKKKKTLNANPSGEFFRSIGTPKGVFLVTEGYIYEEIGTFEAWRPQNNTK